MSNQQHTPICLIASLMLPLSLSANVMTFDPLDADFAEYSTYIEDGITFSAADGASEHFHADTSGTGTGATIFRDDGSPQDLAFISGPFDLISFEIFGFTADTNARIVAS